MSLKPRAYLEGSVEFFDLEIKVDSRCLIPRLETELLVERIYQRLPQNAKVLDLCCGSGAIGLALKSLNPKLEVVLSDVSVDALVVARENARLNNLDVEVVCGDFLAPHKGCEFDAIICNPPYVTEKEYEELDESVKGYEPKLALVADGDGLSFYKRLSEGFKAILKPGGLIALEIGKDQGEAVKQLFSGSVVEKDYSGHDRFIFFKRGGS